MLKPTVSPCYCLLCATLCWILICDVAIATATGGGEEPIGVREARSVGIQVAMHPVDCVQSEWTAWTLRRLQEEEEDTVKCSMVEDFVSVVRGGDSESITSLAAKKLPTPQLMRRWGEAVHYNPDFLRSKMRPLYELVTSRDFSRAISLKKNLRRQLLPLCPLPQQWTCCSQRHGLQRTPGGIY